jgi:hypothetical protein
MHSVLGAIDNGEAMHVVGQEYRRKSVHFLLSFPVNLNNSKKKILKKNSDGVGY